MNFLVDYLIIEKENMICFIRVVKDIRSLVVSQTHCDIMVI